MGDRLALGKVEMKIGLDSVPKLSAGRLGLCHMYR